MPSRAEVVRSRDNPLVKRLRALKQRASPTGGLMLLEGPKLVGEALLAGIALVEVACEEHAPSAPARAALFAELRARGIPQSLVDARLLAQLGEVETSQGMLAIGRRPRFEPQALFAAPEPLVIVALAVQDPGNLGGLLRTAEAAGASGALLTRGCADPFSWKALRGAMGSAFRLPHASGLDVEGALALARAHGLRLAAAVAPAAAGAVPAWEADLRGPLAVLLGNEGAGLPADVAARADLRVTIPSAPAVESLNVGVAAGVLLFESARQRRARRGRTPPDPAAAPVPAAR